MKRETDLGSMLFPKCSPQTRTPTESHRIGLRREGEGGNIGYLGIKRKVKKGERVIKPVSTLLSKNGY